MFLVIRHTDRSNAYRWIVLEQLEEYKAGLEKTKNYAKGFSRSRVSLIEMDPIGNFEILSTYKSKERQLEHVFLA